LTPHHHADGKPYSWAVTLSDYDPDNPYAFVTSATFDSKDEAEAFIAECKSRPAEQDHVSDIAEFDDFPPF
jgi:hypothetical protein